MPELNFTPEQRAAIDTRGSTVLVSAAAGSGKTRVLTERLMAYLTDAEHPVDIDHFLVITYTRAAAAELSSRILDGIYARIASDPENRRLRRQGIPFAAGILQEHDLDFPAAKALAVDVISSPAFQPMGKGAYTQALAVLKTCETVLCCCPGFGPDNDANRRLLNAAQEMGKPVAFSEGGSHGL